MRKISKECWVQVPFILSFHYYFCYYSTVCLLNFILNSVTNIFKSKKREEKDSMDILSVTGTNKCKIFCIHVENLWKLNLTQKVKCEDFHNFFLYLVSILHNKKEAAWKAMSDKSQQVKAERKRSEIFIISICDRLRCTKENFQNFPHSKATLFLPHLVLYISFNGKKKHKQL